MKDTYVLTIRIPILAVDDIEAREYALKVREYSGMGIPDSATWKLQQIFQNGQPRHVDLSNELGKSSNPVNKGTILTEKIPERILFQQNWRELSEWGGPSNDGASFHGSIEEVNLYIKDHTKDRNPNDIPEDYDVPDGSPFQIQISEDLYNQILEAGIINIYGIRIGEENLKKFGLSVRPR